MTDTLYPDPPRGSWLPGAPPDTVADNPPDPGTVELPDEPDELTPWSEPYVAPDPRVELPPDPDIDY
jgi:hypothetical protein